jgi:mannose-6-phosphate isomerase-like protein (cupin superfamily)
MSTKLSVPNLIPKIDKPWSPKLLANLNNEYDVKVARLRGSYIFHAHPETDELFYIISGTLLMKLKENEASPLDDLVVSLPLR